ncbi:molybdenum cofactor biosynthesis protein B [Escherichia coli]|uniref:Molybdenum cofactor biosynthesis protein B n=1 Tax=Escherichia coli TaxID=562 RepID=A0A376PY08_ECOLX|nr:molybdenum cofactor biosynthesis protein B [Escherichia coli]
MSQVSTEFIPTRIAILTVSNRRGEEDDTSGHYLRDSAQEAGHHVVDKAIVKEKPLRYSRSGICVDRQRRCTSSIDYGGDWPDGRRSGSRSAAAVVRP